MLVDSTQQHIIITGDNLLFLSEPVKINNKETWLTKEQEDKKIVVMRLGSLNNNPKIKITNVTIETAFGQKSQNVEVTYYASTMFESRCNVQVGV
jgi:hypothetical protein